MDASKPVARQSNDSKQHMAVCGLFQHLGSLESHTTLEQKFNIFQIGTLSPHGINKYFSLNQYTLVCLSPYFHL